MDRSQVAGEQRVGVQAEPDLSSAEQVVDEDIGAVAQVAYELLPFRTVQRHGDAALAAVVLVERRVQGRVHLGLSDDPADRITAHRLDLDYVRAEVGHHGGGAGGGHPPGDLDDADTRQRPGHRPVQQGAVSRRRP